MIHDISLLEMQPILIRYLAMCTRKTHDLWPRHTAYTTILLLWMYNYKGYNYTSDYIWRGIMFHKYYYCQEYYRREDVTHL